MSHPDDHSKILHRNPHTQRGFTAVPNDLLHLSSLSLEARFLYILLKSYAWKHGSAWPGQTRLAEAMGRTDRSVRTYLDELKTARLLTIEHRGANQTNVYWLEDPPPTQATGAENISAPSSPKKPRDRKPASGPLRKPTSGPDRKPTSDKEDEGEEDKIEERLNSPRFFAHRKNPQNPQPTGSYTSYDPSTFIPCPTAGCLLQIPHSWGTCPDHRHKLKLPIKRGSK